MNTIINLCKTNKQIASEVCDFVYKAKPNEESVTDYFLYRLKEANKKFNYINTTQFNRRQEATTGADYELELWLVGQKIAIPLLIQAKKMYANGNYCDAINYPRKTTKQLNTLISYATVNKKIPFYMFYAIPDGSTQTMCGGSICGIDGKLDTCCLFLSDALEIQKMANNCINSSSKVSKNNILAKSNPFICLFCCPLTLHENNIDDYFKHYYKSSYEFFGKFKISIEDMPDYAKRIMNNEVNDDYMESVIEKFELDKIKNIAVMKIDNIGIQ